MTNADLPTSGVSAATYGDATHVGQFAVNSRGVITSASNVAISGGASSPLTTKGDVWGYSTTDARIPVGSNNQVLTADSAQALGVKWGGAVQSVDSITGAVSLVAGSNVTITDNSPGAGQITITAAGSGSSNFAVVDYVEFTSNVSITATTEGTANAVVSGAGFTADGSSSYLVEFFSPAVHSNASTGAHLRFVLLEASTVLGQAAGLDSVSVTTQTDAAYFARRVTPASGTRTYKVQAFELSGTAVVGAGTGGSGNNLPGYIMVTKQA